MSMWLRQSTASQEILLGKFVDSTDAVTAETALSIANTDIQVWKEGATTLANKNSGGATHISGGLYYAVLDATDTDTLGKLEINVAVSGALAVRREYMVLPSVVYDAMVLGTDNLDVNVAQWLGTAAATPTVAGVPEVDVTHLLGTAWLTPGTAGTPDVNVKLISDDATAANNAESFFDGTGYAGTNNVIPAVTTVTNLTNAPTNGDLTATMKTSVTTAATAATPTAAAVTGNVGGNVAGSIGSLGAQAKLDVNAEADTALSDYGALKPTTAGRTLDVSATGEAGIDWANVGSPTTVLNLSGTTVKTATDVEADTADIQTKIGTPAGVSVSADVAAVKSETAAIVADTNELQTDWANGGRLDVILDARASQASVDDLPTNAELATALGTADDAVIAVLGAPVGASLSADIAAVKAGTLTAASKAKIDRSAGAICTGTVGVGSTTTSIVTSALSPAGGVADQFKGRIVIFDDATTTAALRGQATDITASSNAALAVLTVTALTTAPASTDTFTIT